MPITRSAKDAPLPPPPKPTTSAEGLPVEDNRTGGTPSSSRMYKTDTSTTTFGSTATEVTEKTTTTTATSGETVSTGRSKKKSSEDLRPTQKQPASNTTLVPTKRPRSKKTTSSVNRRKELEAREELARRELEKAQAAMELAKVRMELVQLEESEDDSVEEDEEYRRVQVQNWVRTSQIRERSAERQEQEPPEDLRSLRNEQPQASGRATTEIQALADAIRQAITTHGTAPPKFVHELPFFDGNSSEWIAFKVVYEDSASMFTEAQNMARLRKAIRGNAREAIKSLLFSEASPEEVMQALRRRFGRPDALVLAELDKIKMLSRISENPRDICTFASQINNSVAAIKGLKRPQYLHSPEIMKQIIEKLPTILKFRWYDFTSSHDDNDFSDLTEISRFLNKEADKCCAYATEERAQRRTPYRQASHAAVEQDGRQTTQQKVEKVCPHCQKGHFLSECQQFQKLSVQERWAMVIKQRLCFKCLGGRHRKDYCKRPTCKICNKWHHHLLHSERPSEESPKNKEEVIANIASPVNAVKTRRAYLKMAKIEVFGPRCSKKILALLDEGSTISLLDSKVAEEIGATGEQQELVLETVGGRVIRKEDSKTLNLKIREIHQDNLKNLNRVHTVDDLKLSPQFLDKKRIECLPHLKTLADTLCYEPESPQLLIGQDNWELITSKATKKGRPGQPVASLTELGWVLHGYDSKGKPANSVNTCMHVKMADDVMHEMIKDHFAIESLGVQPRRPATDLEGKALSILEKTCKRLEDGRFEAGLLWKKEDEKMPESYTSAERRLRSIEKKIDKDPHLKSEYCKQMQHLLDSNYAEEAPENDKSERKWYLPHFSVVHPLKKKIRIVFDAAAKSHGKSLNDALLPGPDLLQSLFGVLLRFRQGPMAVAADIKEMFLQIKIRPEDRDSLRFLWRGDKRDGTPKEYRMTSVIFGASSSPSTAIFVKNRNATDFKEEYPEAAKAIERNHYMDDYLHSFHSEEELKKRIEEIDFIHKKAGFELRGWASNHPHLLKKVTDEAPEKKEVNLGEREEKTLGLRWLIETDSIAFRTNLRNTPEDVLHQSKMPTKREVTSAVMSTFDPLGLISPILIQGKKLLQAIWRSGIGWDEEIEDKENTAWKSYLKNLDLLKNLHISRCIAPQRTEGELHIFTDASETAYAAAVYWRTEEADGSFRTNLVASKARVTPLKPVSVPRLELQAALMGSRLADSLAKELDLEVKKKTYWTDSSVVLSWIKSDPRTFKTFVAHRLAEIEDLTKPQEWRWVPTAQNPADDATRQVPEGFDSEHRWFTGPAFLREDESHWPAPRTFKKDNTGEERETEISAAVSTSHNYACPDPARFSSWTRLWRSTARVLQFIKLCRTRERVNISRRCEKDDPTWGKRKKHKDAGRKYSIKTSTIRLIPLDEDSLEKAEILLLKRSQEESFGEDIRRLQHNKQLENCSKLKKLDVELQNGLLRLKGRIDAIRGVTQDYKRPIMLNSKNKITRLLIEEYHKKFNHGNHATVMNELRQRFLILGVRSAIRMIVHQCQWCKLKRSKPQEVPTGDLPPERLHHGSPPFTCAAVDYFGPMSVTVGRRHEKRWGALFTCLTTRAVHLELVPSLSTDSMIMALRRFAARRGMPKTLYSDNGTNFVGADKELRTAVEEMKDELTTKTEKIGIKWKFIPPGAPNMGGAWERLVRSVKTALKATLNETHPREEVLHTLLLEAEHVVNSRPLTHLADNPDEEALTPNHFLIGRSCGAAKIGVFTGHELVGRATWQSTQKLADHFWQRWLREYLPTLLERKMKVRGSLSLQVGDLVLIVDSSLPRCTWPRGRISEVYPGPDGRIRVVNIQTKNGTLRRPSSRVVLLVPNESPSQEDGAAHEGETVGDHTS